MIFSSITATFSLQIAALSSTFFASSESALGSSFLFVFCCFFVFIIALVIFGYLIPLSKIFVKAGQPGWQAYIPYLNICVLAHITGRDWWWGLIPILNIVPVFDLAKAFGKSDGYGVGLVLLPYVFIPMLGYGDAQFQLERRQPLF